MRKMKKPKGKLPWHSAFYAGIQIELEEDADKLTFESEHHLGTDPMRIDVLIIKKHTEEQIKKNIGCIFREHNIIEYKSPEQYLSIDAFYKVLGYACFYKSDVQYVDTIPVEEITITYVSKSYPRKLSNHLKTVRGYQLVPKWNGIWYIEGGTFPMQLIVTSRLSKEDNFWLRNLTNDLKRKEDANELFEQYEKNKESNLHKSVMDLVMRANETVFKEARGDMCDALYELMKDKIDEEVESKVEKLAKELVEAKAEELAEAKFEMRFKEQIKKKLAKGKSVEQIADELEESVERVQMFMQSFSKI